MVHETPNKCRISISDAHTELAAGEPESEPESEVRRKTWLWFSCLMFGVCVVKSLLVSLFLSNTHHGPVSVCQSVLHLSHSLLEEIQLIALFRYIDKLTSQPSDPPSRSAFFHLVDLTW